MFLPTQFKVCFISPLVPPFKNYEQEHFSSREYPGHNHISLTVLYFDQWSCHPFKRTSWVVMWSRLIQRPRQNKLAEDINRTQRWYHKIIAKCMVICSALSASRDAHQPVFLRLYLFIVSSWWWVSSLCLIKERALDVLTISDHRITFFQYLPSCRHQTVNL